MIFLVGFCVATVIWFTVIWWYSFSKRSPIVTVDPWWLENEERWVSLRRIILEERGRHLTEVET